MRTYERLVLLGAGIAAVAVIGAWYATTTDDGTDAPSLDDAAAACINSGSTDAAQVRDDGHTLILSAGGLGDEPTFTEVACVLGALDAPASVTASMERTRALDGVQDAAWGTFTASWTYHPDNGLDLILEAAPLAPDAQRPQAEARGRRSLSWMTGRYAVAIRSLSR